VLRKILGPKKEAEVTVWCRKLCYEELKDLYILGDRLKNDTIGKEHGMNGEKINAYRCFIGKPGGKRALERHRCIVDDNIKMDLKEVGLGLDWIYLAPGV